MKRKLAIIGLLLFVLVNAAFAQKDWENEHVLERNKMGARVPSYSYTSEKDADRKQGECPDAVVDGTWKFNFVEDVTCVRLTYG